MRTRTLSLIFYVLVAFATSAQVQVTDFQTTDFTSADSIAKLYEKHSLKDLKSLSDKLTAPFTTEEEKFRVIYKWICNNIEYDYELYLRNQHEKTKLKGKEDIKKWNKKFSALVFRNLLTKQKTVCSGYAYLLKELASHAGLSCVSIDGYARNAKTNVRGKGEINHSWNAIQLHKKWYLCDVTWSSGFYDADRNRYVKKYDPSYFLPDPSVFVRNHYPSDTTWTLLFDKPSLKEFLNRPVIYSSAFRYRINQLVPETFDISARKGKTVSFQFTKNSDRPIMKAELYIVGAKTKKSVYPNLYQNASGFYCIDHTFTSEGLYDVHVLLNYSYAFTYSVRVK